jgi:mannosyltransferase
MALSAIRLSAQAWTDLILYSPQGGNMIARMLRLRVKQPRLWMGLVAGILTALALMIRLIGLGAESGWIDEAYSIVLARYPISQIIHGTAADQHPPFYYLLLHIWMQFGTSVPYARLFSALLGTLNVVQVLVIGWKIGGERLGIGAALLVNISPFHVWYSQEARQYMLLACLTTAATIELWNCLHGKSARWWLYWLFATLAIYTQYFAVFILLTHAVLVGIWAYRLRSWRLVASWSATILGLGIAFLPWLPTSINQFLYHSMTWISDPVAGDVRDIPLRLILGSGVLVLPELLRWIGLAGLLGISGWVLFRLRQNEIEIRWGFGFISAWALIPFTAISVVAVFYPVFQFKQYLIILVPFLLAATGMALVIPREWGRLFFVGLVLAGGLTLVYQQAVLTKDDWRGVAVYIGTNAESGDMVYSNPAASSLVLGLYWENALPFEGYPPHYDILQGGWAGQSLNTQMAEEQLSIATQSYTRVWLVEFYPEFWDANNTLETWLIAHGEQRDDLAFGNIRLRLFDIGR